ncbi:outer mitochondrial membrane isoform [Scheffersomyces amazonensis]|uniref:outer mitochondrial membrane isoform n=1 Tax=Scheffersomyces amazonensis TaxID=1078765 RepID=UPI00315DB058
MITQTQTITEKFRPPQFYTLDQVRNHNSPGDLWMIIYNRVYDITDFAHSHPGGIEVLFDCGGVDATEAFDDVAHSDDAFNMLAPYFVGDLIPHEQIKYKKQPSHTVPSIYIENNDDTKPQKFVKSISNSKKSKSNTTSKKSKKGKKSSTPVEKLTIAILILLVIFSLILYVGVQKLKWTYHVHSS